jgi:hypothetical protein
MIAVNIFNFNEAVGKTVFAPISGSNFNFPNFVQLAIRLLFIGIVLGFFFYLLLGAAQWVFSGGDKEAVSKAQKRITNALVGLAIAFSIYVIVSLIDVVFGVNILNLAVPRL